ncbi:MAG: hypothetical protein J7L11_01285 [Thermoprotei archaeon]|nr:hypothetical protein [Thermoprotei archaeon]
MLRRTTPATVSTDVLSMVGCAAFLFYQMMIKLMAPRWKAQMRRGGAMNGDGTSGMLPVNPREVEANMS